MKKLINALLLASLVVGLAGPTVVFAQGPDDDPDTPLRELCGEDCPSLPKHWREGHGGARLFANPPGRMGGPDAAGRGLMEEYLAAFAAEKLGLTVEEIEERLETGETLAEIAISEGVEDYRALIAEAMRYAREQIAASGVDLPGWGRWNTDSERGKLAPRDRQAPGQCNPADPGPAARRGGRGRHNR